MNTYWHEDVLRHSLSVQGDQAGSNAEPHAGTGAGPLWSCGFARQRVVRRVSGGVIMDTTERVPMWRSTFVGIDVRRSEFMDKNDDLEWLYECCGCSKPDGIPWGSVILFGNDDGPEAVVCYEEVSPFVSTTPAAMYVRDRTGELVCVDNHKVRS